MAQDEFGFDSRVINVLQKKDEFINATEQTFFNSLSAVEQSVFKAVWAQAQKMNQDSGNVLFDEENIDIINKIQKTIQTALQSSNYPKDVKEYLRSFENIKKFNLQANESVNDLDPAEVETLVNPVQKAVVNQTLEGLTGSGVDTNFIQPVKEGIFKNVVAGSTMADLEKTLRQLIISGEIESKLKRYVTQVSRDALNQFDGQVNSAIANEFGLDAYRYVGSLIDDSRAQCIRWTGKQVLLKEDLQKEISWATSNGTGMIAGTTPDNFATFRGGYNCRHSAIPFKLTASQRAKLQQDSPEKESQIEVEQAQAKAAKEQEKVKQQEIKVEAAKEQVKEAKIVAKEEEKKAAVYKDITRKVAQTNNNFSLTKEEEDYYLKISGIPEDAKGSVKFFIYSVKNKLETLNVNFESESFGDGITMYRTFNVNENTIQNDYFRIVNDSKYKGQGAKIFANQVKAATEAGYKTIKTSAASGLVYNGYYTWARLGYEPSAVKIEKVLSKFKNQTGAEVKTWGELLGTKTGQSWWKINGDSFEGTFDLSANSYSQTTLKNYLESKGKPQQTAKEIEAIRKAEEAEAKRKAKEEERKRKEEERKRKAEEKARKAEEAARKKAEAEAKRKAKEEEKARKAEEKKRKAEEKKRKEEEAARKKAEAQAAEEAQKKKPASFTLKNQEEIDAFTKDSVLKQTFLHSTSVKNVDSIKANGFNNDKIQIGRYFGNGVYVTDDPKVAEIYAKTVVEKSGTSPATLSLKVNVKKPFIYDQDEIERRWIAADRDSPMEIYENEYTDELLKQDPAFATSYKKFRKQYEDEASNLWKKYETLNEEERIKFFDEVVLSQPNSFYSALTSAAKENGYDSFYFKDRQFNVQGGQQLVVFDPKNVRVIDLSKLSAEEKKQQKLAAKNKKNSDEPVTLEGLPSAIIRKQGGKEIVFNRFDTDNYEGGLALQKLDEQLVKQTNATAEEARAIAGYKGAYYTDMNKQLRQGKYQSSLLLSKGNLDREMADRITLVKDAIKKNELPDNFVLHRGYEQRFPFNPFEGNNIDILKKNFRLTDLAFRSASFDLNVSKKFLRGKQITTVPTKNGTAYDVPVITKILAKKGSKGVWAEQYERAYSEAEWLLDSGSELNVLQARIISVDGKQVLELITEIAE